MIGVWRETDRGRAGRLQLGLGRECLGIFRHLSRVRGLQCTCDQHAVQLIIGDTMNNTINARQYLPSPCPKCNHAHRNSDDGDDSDDADPTSLG